MTDASPIIVPIRRPGDLERVGAAAVLFASTLGLSIEVVTVLHPSDDIARDTARFRQIVEDFAVANGVSATLDVVVDESEVGGVIERCAGHLVCMATSASPFDDDHYVGSIASELVARSSLPVILLGPQFAYVDELTIGRVVLAHGSGVDAAASSETARRMARSFAVPIARLTIDAEKAVIHESDSYDPERWFPDQVHASLRSEPLDHDALVKVLLERTNDGLLVVATRAKRGLAWICEGSVSFDVIARSTMPVVAVGPEVRLSSSGGVLQGNAPCQTSTAPRAGTYGEVAL